MNNRNWTALLFAWLSLAFLTTCTPSVDSDTPTIGFVDAFEDNTIKQAKDGFFAALQDKGFSEAEGTLQVIYRNAQGDIPTLTQIVRYFISQQVDLMATSPSLSTITALQNTQEIPVFMMVSPTPRLMKVMDQQGNAPDNLFGVAEQLAYIDTSFSIIPKLVQAAGDQLKVGLLYNQSEPQSVEAYNKLNVLARQLNIQLVARPVNTTADVQLVTAALINEQIDAFFANPDNTIFGAFETILKSCNEADVPIFTSEAGLVSRGAVAAFGADIYQWGYQAGEQAAAFLEKGNTEDLQWEMVKERKRVYNPEAAERFGIEIPKNYVSIKR
jgi:putative ABC transport system substrate-binding protein